MLKSGVAGDGGQASANHHAETHFLCQIASSMFPGKRCSILLLLLLSILSPVFVPGRYNSESG